MLRLYKILKYFYFVIFVGCLFSCKKNELSPESFFLSQESPDSIFVENSSYIAVLGDIQEYTNSNELLYYLIKTNNWLRWQQEYT